jgi:hypothetical protein
VPSAGSCRCSKSRANGRSRRTLDLLQACRMTSVRTDENRPANRAFSLKPPTIGGPRVRNQSDRTQRNKATAATKNTCKTEVLRERLKGFEPSTFCMASSAGGALLSNFIPANRSLSGYACRGPFARLSPANHGSLWTQCGPEARGLKQTVCATAPRESDTGSRCERRSTEPKATGPNPVGRATRLGRSCVFAATSLSRARSPVSSLGSS